MLAARPMLVKRASLRTAVASTDGSPVGRLEMSKVLGDDVEAHELAVRRQELLGDGPRDPVVSDPRPLTLRTGQRQNEVEVTNTSAARLAS